MKYHRPPDELIQPSAAWIAPTYDQNTHLQNSWLSDLLYYNSKCLTPPQNLTSTQFLKGILVLIFAGSGEPPKTVLLLEYPQEVKMRLFFHST